MGRYSAALIKGEEVAENTFAVHLEKPFGFEFKAGQYLDVSLSDPPETDAEGDTRTFSIASAPYENEILLATRLRDTAFKRVLRRLSPGAELELEGPMGSFTLHKNASKPAAFLAGGIGITPFLSMLRQAAKDQAGSQLYLFYSNRRPEDAAFLTELERLQSEAPRFHFIPSMSEMDRSSRPWKGETGFITADMLKRHLSDLHGPIYYVAGPPAMVKAMGEMLTAAGVSEDDIRTEDFAGY